MAGESPKLLRGDRVGDDSRAAPVLVIALAVAAFFSLWRLDTPLWGAEGHFAEIAREMSPPGDPFSMTIGGKPYPDKPFGSYWLILASARMAGGFSERAARIPSALSFIATTLVVYVLGRRTLGAREGAFAALLFATSFRLLCFGRQASADPQNMLAIAVGLLLVLEASEAGRWYHFPLLGVVAAVGSLMKGLPSVAVPVFVAFLWAALARGFRWLRPAPIMAGAVLFALTLGTPFLIAYRLHGNWSPLQLLWRESVVRVTDTYDHFAPWHFYFWRQFDLLAPWAVLLPAALVFGFSKLRERAGARPGWGLRMADQPEERRRVFPLFCYLAIFLFFNLSRSKRTYYLMPIAPFACLICAQVLLEAAQGWTLWLKRIGIGILAAAALLGGVGAAVLGTLRLLYRTAPTELPFDGRLVPEIWLAIPVWLAAMACLIPLGLLLLWRLVRNASPLAPLLSAAALATLMTLGVMESVRSTQASLPGFCSTVRQIVPPDETILRGDLSDAKLLFYLQRPTIATAKEPPRFLLATSERAGELLAREPAKYLLRCRRAPNPGSRPLPPDEAYVLLERVN